MIKCAEILIEKNVDCPCEECRLWIDHEEDQNCTIVAVDNNKDMTLREVADRMGISFVRVKQIQDQALKKVLKRFNRDKVY